MQIEIDGIFTEDQFVIDDDYYDTMPYPQEEQVYVVGDLIMGEDDAILDFFI